MQRIISLSFGKLAIITLLIAFIVSVVLTVNMKEKANPTDKSIDIEASEYVSGSKKQT